MRRRLVYILVALARMLCKHTRSVCTDRVSAGGNRVWTCGICGMDIIQHYKEGDKQYEFSFMHTA